MSGKRSYYIASLDLYDCGNTEEVLNSGEEQYSYLIPGCYSIPQILCDDLDVEYTAQIEQTYLSASPVYNVDHFGNILCLSDEQSQPVAEIFVSDHFCFTAPDHVNTSYYEIEKILRKERHLSCDADVYYNCNNTSYKEPPTKTGNNNVYRADEGYLVEEPNEN